MNNKMKTLFKKTTSTDTNIKKKSAKERTSDFFDVWDMYGTPVPSFTVKGHTHHGTSIGFLSSLVFYVTILSFSLLKFVQLVQKKNPMLATISVPVMDNQIDMNSTDMMVAFGARTLLKQGEASSLNDDNLVEWLP
jgi:hypothetical protein